MLCRKGKLEMKKLVAAVVIAMAPLASFAAGFQINEDSPRLQGQAMAGSGAATGDVTAIFNNPALLSSLDHDQVYVGSSYIAPNISMKNASAVNYSYINTGPDPFYYPTTITGSSSEKSVADSAVVPNMFAAMKLSSSLTAGLAVTAPWGLTTDYDSNSIVRYLAQKTALKTINITPELSYRLNQQWQFGVGLQAQYADAEFSEFDGSAGLLPATSPTTLSGDGWGIGYLVGATYSPTDKTTFGLSYRSQIDYDLKGNGQQYVQAGPIQPTPYGPGSNLPFNSNTSVSADMNTPAVINFSVQQKLTQRWTVSTTEQMTMWHSLQKIKISMPDAYSKSQTIPLNWQNSWLYSVGTQYEINQHWQIRTGLAYDTTPVTDHRDARIPDSNRTWTTVGASYVINKNFTVDAAYEHIFMANQNIDTTKEAGFINGVPQEKDTLTADYKGNANIVALGVNWKF